MAVVSISVTRQSFFVNEWKRYFLGVVGSLAFRTSFKQAQDLIDLTFTSAQHEHPNLITERVTSVLKKFRTSLLKRELSFLLVAAARAARHALYHSLTNSHVREARQPSALELSGRMHRRSPRPRPDPACND